MKPTKAIYSVRKNNGPSVIEGDFDTIKAWLAEGKILSDDDLRREGLHVYESDELWGRVKDFPEFNCDDREGRRELVRARKRTVWASIAAIFFLLIGVSLIIYNQILPRYSESKKINDAIIETENAKKSEQQAIQRAENLEGQTNQKIKDLEAAKEATIKEINEKFLKDVTQLNEEISKLKETVTLYSNNINKLTAEYDKINRQIGAAKIENTQLKDKLATKSEEVGKLVAANDILKLEKAQIEYAHNRDHHPDRLTNKK